jgi:hypothetical protein
MFCRFCARILCLDLRVAEMGVIPCKAGNAKVTWDETVNPRLPNFNAALSSWRRKADAAFLPMNNFRIAEVTTGTRILVKVVPE